MTTAKKPSTGTTKTARPKTGQTPRATPQKFAQTRPVLPSPVYLTAAYAIVTNQNSLKTIDALTAASDKVAASKDMCWAEWVDGAMEVTTLNILMDEGEHLFVEALIAFAGTEEVRSRVKEWLG